MGTYRELHGDLIELAKKGKFDVVVHGCNCFNKMGAGIAVKFAEVFGADRFELEHPKYRGDKNKLGMIDCEELHLSSWDEKYHRELDENEKALNSVYVVNAYTQYHYGKGLQLDYEALRLCLRKINDKFKSSKIGLPQIGCGLAGGNWNVVKSIIKDELRDMDVEVIIYVK
jgi:O-acetyl-ADP-ribose deacetylase (regulator of RNase III)